MRGDVYRVRAPRDARGHEQQGARYGVVVQADALSHLSTWLVALTSTSAQPAGWRPEVEINGKTTRVVIDQTMALDRSRLGDFAGRLTASEIAEVNAALTDVFDL